jgi:hypothetical protein
VIVESIGFRIVEVLFKEIHKASGSDSVDDTLLVSAIAWIGPHLIGAICANILASQSITPP